MSYDGQADPQTIPELFLWRANSTPRLRAYGNRTGVRQWNELRWNHAIQQIQNVSHYLCDLGLKPGDRLAIAGDTCLQWHLVESAAMMAGVIPVGIDHGLPPEQQRQLAEDCDPAAIVCQNPADFMSSSGATLRRLILLREQAGATKGTPQAIPWAEIASTTIARSGTKRIRVTQGQPALWIYTSGTTGRPKAIEYTHGQLMIACKAIAATFDSLRVGDAALCWLPMAHLFQRMMNFAAVRLGVTVYFVEDPRTVVDCAREVHPSVFVGVPRFYEKLREGIDQQIAQSSSRIQRLATRVTAPLEHSRSIVDQVTKPLMNQIVTKRLRAVLGKKMRILITGSAPMEMSLLRYFERIGWPILEAYGVTENTIPVASNRPECYRLGSVGEPFAGNEIRLDADGEILVRGDGVFQGYVGNARSSEDFTKDEFYRTGDLGRFDDDGFLYVLGRKDDVFKTSTGRRIIPAKIEGAYLQSSFIERIVVFGKGRKNLVGLIWLQSEEVRRHLERKLGSSIECTGQDIVELEAVNALIDRELEQCGQGLASHERVRRFAFVGQPMSLERNELTTTMKVRRKQVEDSYSQQIAELYENDASEDRDPAVVNSGAMAR